MSLNAAEAFRANLSLGVFCAKSFASSGGKVEMFDIGWQPNIG